MPYKEKKVEKLYYSIGEVAEMLEVPVSTVRFWENEFDILKPMKNKKGNRLFTPADIKNLKIIHHLVKEEGMTLAGCKKEDSRKSGMRQIISLRSMNRCRKSNQSFSI